MRSLSMLATSTTGWALWVGAGGRGKQRAGVHVARGDDAVEGRLDRPVGLRRLRASERRLGDLHPGLGIIHLLLRADAGPSRQRSVALEQLVLHLDVGLGRRHLLIRVGRLERGEHLSRG